MYKPFKQTQEKIQDAANGVAAAMKLAVFAFVAAIFALVVSLCR
jgi:hypothetical protein